MEVYTSIYDMFRKCGVKKAIGRPPQPDKRPSQRGAIGPAGGLTSVRWVAPLRDPYKKSPDVETTGLRYLDLISVFDWMIKI
jgi:hypothetical protein